MKTDSTHRKYLGWALFAGASLMVIALLMAAVKPQPERFTELYFNQPQQLPSVWPGKPVAFAFHVHNVEGRGMTYNYQVLEATAADPQLAVKQGRLALASGGEQDVPVQLVVPEAKVRTEVTVLFPDTQQQIHFWIEA